MKVVINSSPLIALLSINQIHLLSELFDEIIVPDAVYKEVVIDGNDKLMEIAIKNLSNIKILKPTNSTVLEFIAEVLDKGEAEVIAIAKELKIDTVIIDELKGRKYARRHHLDTIGTLGILILAKNKQLIKNIAPLLKKMENNGIRIGDKLKQKILKIAKED